MDMTHATGLAEAHAANRPLADPALVACPNCDLVQRVKQVEPGESARCPRCNTELRRGRKDALTRTLALTIAAAVLYIITNTTPMLGLQIVGRESFTTVMGGAMQLWKDGQEIVAALVFFAVVLAPALQIGFLLLVVLGCSAKRPGVWVGVLLRYHPFTKTWSMIEVMLIGVLVALTKIAELAHVIPGEALFSVGGLVIVLAAMQSNFDPQEVWRRIQWVSPEAEAKAGNLGAEGSAP
jgi:paraquat-inducible protein A